MNNDKAVEKIEGSSRLVSVSNRFERAKRSLCINGEKTSQDTVFILDVSGSMNAYVGNKRKIDHLREAVDEHIADVPIISFSDTLWFDEIPEPNQSTDMTKAFDACKEHYSPKRILLVSDGQPNNRSSALAAGVSLGVPIDVLFIGAPGEYGEDFMKELAKATKGHELTVDTMNEMNFGKMLTEGVRMLCAPKQDEAIQL